MSNLANYSPQNKTYKFLLFQNQAYHQKNKKLMKPCVRTNLRYFKNHSFSNPENSQAYQNKPITSSTKRCESPTHSMARSMLLSNRSMRSSQPVIDQPKRVIHKHHSFQKFKCKKIENENSKLVCRLIETSCEIPKNEKSEKSFKNHLKYRQIRKKYDSNGIRKQPLALINSSMFCPTLKEYNESNEGEKFIKLDMSWVSKHSSPSPKRRTQNFSCA